MTLPDWVQPTPQYGETTPHFVARALDEIDARHDAEVDQTDTLEGQDKAYSNRDARISRVMLWQESGVGRSINEAQRRDEQRSAHAAVFCPDPFRHARGMGD